MTSPSPSKIQKRVGGLKTPVAPIMCENHPTVRARARRMCTNCYSKWLLAKDPAFKERQRQNTRDWIAKNLDKYREKSRANGKAWRARQDKEYMRGKRLFKRFGITLEQYDALLAAQNGVCSICQKPAKPGKSLSVDHNHDTIRESDEIRGLLCFRCNFGLSYFGENADTLSRAAEHVRGGHARVREILSRLNDASETISDKVSE